MADLRETIAAVVADGGQHMATCPAHDDGTASLSVGRGDDGRVLLSCLAGCHTADVLAAAGLHWRDVFPAPAAKTSKTIVATYDYVDEQGDLLYQVVRMEPKTFRQRRPDGAGKWIWKLGDVRRVLFRLLELRGTREVFVVEGEKDVLALRALGLAATCNAGGAGKWIDDYSRQLIAAGVESVVVLPDNDDPGREHARQVAASCHASGLTARIVELPGLPLKGDVSDWLAAGGTTDALRALAATTPTSAPAARVDLPAALTTFRRWLYLNDPTAVYAVAATLAANRAAGDPVWLLLVCAPSTGKTEILSAAGSLPYVVSAAKVTEASLLSGTSRKEKTKDATGGLLRQIGDFGILLVKDFTSVLAQNSDARAEALAALREVYDGDWHRPVGTDGGKVLSWRGKCGLIGGVTPALDQYTGVLSSLGDRFILLRMPDADVDAFGAAALQHGDHEKRMRQELQGALSGLVEHADLTRVNRPLTDDEQRRLIGLAAYTARVRTAVVRDSQHNVMYLPQVEGPGRLVKAYARFLGGLEAIGCDTETAWQTVTRVALDSAPALRTRFIADLLKRQAPARTSDLATSAEVVTKTAGRYLEDLAILRVATRSKHGTADNSPDLWEATTWLREHHPESETNKYPPSHQTQVRGTEEKKDNREPSFHGGVDDGPTFTTTEDRDAYRL